MEKKHSKFVVFLDVDGVLNTRRTVQRSPKGYTGVDHARVEVLANTMKKYGGGDIVLTSDWKNYTVTYKNNKNVGKAIVTVKFKGEYYSGKLTKTFTIKPKATYINTIRVEGNSVSLKVKKQTKQITGYQIQYATKKNFENAKKTEIKSYKTTDKKISDLKEKTKYYVRVRAYKEVKNGGKKKRYYSEWSATKQVTTDAVVQIKYGNVDRTYEEAYAYFASKYPISKMVYNRDGSISFYEIISHGPSIPKDAMDLYVGAKNELYAKGHSTVSSTGDIIEQLYGSDGYGQWSLIYSTMTGSN